MKNNIWINRGLWTVVAIQAIVMAIVLLLYIRTYTTPVTVPDELNVSVPIALATQTDDPILPTIVKAYFGHRNIINNSITALSATYDNWNVHHLTHISWVLGLVSASLVIALFASYRTEHLPLIAIPLLLLMLSLRSRFNWLTPLYSSWHWLMIWMLCIGLVVRFTDVGLRQLSLLALFSVLASFSAASGIALWAAIGLCLPLLGYRKWTHYAIWLATSIIFMAFYLRGIDILFGIPSGYNGFKVQSSDFIYLPYNFLRYIGNVFTEDKEAIIALAGCVLVVINAVVYYFHRGFNNNTSLWLIYLLVLGIEFSLKFLARSIANIMWIDSWWVTPATLFWIVLLALVYINFDTRKFAVWQSWLLNTINGLAIAIIIGLSAGAQLNELEYIRTVVVDEPLQWQHDTATFHEWCAIFLIERPDNTPEGCIAELTQGFVKPHQYEQLYEYRLNIYADLP